MRESNNKGLSLIEVVISIAILSFLMIILSNSWSGNFLRIRKSKFNDNVAQFLHQKIVETEIKYKNIPIENIPKKESGDFGKEFKNYRWEVESQGFEMPDISSLLIGRDEGASDLLLGMIRATSDFISSSVKEVTVTVYVKIDQKKEKEKEVSYSVSTYIVDYRKEFNLPLGNLGSAIGGGK